MNTIPIVNKDKEKYLLKANSIIQGFVIHKTEEENGDVEFYYGNQDFPTIIFSTLEFDLLNVVLSRLQSNIFYSNMQDYKDFNPYSISIKDLKDSLKMTHKNYAVEINNILERIQDKHFILKNFIHPKRKDENGNFIKYKHFRTGIISNIGYRNPKNEKVSNIDKVSANDIVDIELDDLFKWLLLKPVQKKNLFLDYEKYVKYTKSKNPYMEEEVIKSNFEEQKEEGKKKVAYTSINQEHTRLIKSNYGKRLYEELCSEISYQVKSKKTVNYDYLKITLHDFNKIWGWKETGMTKINKFFKRGDNWTLIKKCIEEELTIKNLNYISYNSDKFIEFTFDPIKEENEEDS